jgi:hypothetical protein
MRRRSSGRRASAPHACVPRHWVTGRSSIF